MLSDQNDYPTSLPRHALRSVMFRSGLTAKLGPRYWQPTSQASFIHELHRRPFQMFADIPTTFADPAYSAMIGPDSARWSLYEETITAIDDAWVEPNRCQIVGPDGRLVRQSMTHLFVPLYPSFWGHRLRRRNSRRVPEAIVYDGFNSTNYYHHLIDCLPSIPLFLERSRLVKDLPLVVNRWIFESPFFAHLRRQSAEFAALNWHVQEPGQWLRVGRAYRLNAVPFDRAAFTFNRGLYGQLSERRGRRIFLSRDSRRFSRGIRNEEAVAALLGTFGFETIYAENLSLEEQQRTFEECEHLVALHGMGLVQQMFMDADRGHVLELMPRNRLHSVYYWQGWTLGMRYYDVLSGSDMDPQGRYEIDLAPLAAAVRKMLNHPTDQRRYGETLIADS